MKPLRLDHEAAEELEAAATWYETRRDGLGLDFVAAVRDTFTRVGDRPALYALEETGVRRAPVRRFPYTVVFIELAEEIRVLAIAHQQREPGYWRGRLL